MSNSIKFMTVSPMFLLFIVFLILKLTNTIDWSWWWVTSPLWTPIALFIGLVFVWLIVLGIITIFFDN